MYGRRWGESDSTVTKQVIERLLPRSKLHKHIDVASRRIGVSRSPEAHDRAIVPECVSATLRPRGPS